MPADLRIPLFRALYACPRIRGRDRLIGALTKSFEVRPRRLPSGLLMVLDPAEWAQQEILIKGATEPQTLQRIREIVTPGSCVIDVGAHVGHHALEAARAAGGTGRVFAFDPQPYNADRIGRHAVLNGLANIVAICAAVGDREAFIRLPMQSERDRSRLSIQEAGPGDEDAFVEVPLRRLDNFMADNDVSSVQLLKIDVEGYELEVLHGLGGSHENCKNIILEMLEATAPERNKAVVSFLMAAGFELNDVAGKPWQWGAPLPENNLWAARL